MKPFAPARRRAVRIGAVIILALVLLGGLPARAGATGRLVVSPQGPYFTLPSALDDAKTGDTIQVRGGAYQGNFVISKSITLEGIDSPALDAGGKGTVITINAPDVTVENFEIRNSGTEPDQDHAGITINAPRAVIARNVLRNVLFGVFVAQAADSIVRDNEITSQDQFDIGRKGDAVRLWYSPRTLVLNNHIHNARDVVIWYSEGAQIRDNFIERGRYGVHLMYCDNVLITNNRLLNNSVGIYIMYSKNVTLTANDIRSQRGPSGYALGFKDADNIRATDNLLIDNRGGIFLDGTPFSPHGFARFQNNIFGFNDIAVTIMPAVRGAEFSDNTFWENLEQMAINGGGGKPDANVWRGNFWSDYSGLDVDGDNLGDTPYVAEKFFENMTDREPLLRALLYSPAAQALEFAATSFPLVKPLPKFSDPAPRIAPPPLPAGASAPNPSGLALLGVAAFLLALFGALLTLARGTFMNRNQSLDPAVGGAPAATPSVVAVRASGVGKRYGKNRVLDHVTFSIPAGSALALWGPNGAGKTTLVQALLGLIPFEGELEILGHATARQGKLARRLVGYVPQQVTFYDWSVRATFEFYARLKRVDAARIPVLLEQMGLTDHAAKPVSALSGGLKQRMALGLALLSDPPILVLDEPTANLDPQARADYVKWVAALKRAGKTILFASHRMEEVEALADTVLWLDAGQPARVLELEAWLGEIAPTAELTLYLTGAQRVPANAFLNAQGYDAHLNGRGTVVVRLRAAQKMRALESLSAHGFQINDFQLERV